MKNQFPVFTYSYKMKAVGLVVLAWGVYLFVAHYWRFQEADFNLMASLSSWGLLFIFFSKEKIDDERVHQLKFRALAWSFPVGICITHLINYFYLPQPDSGSGQLFTSIPAYPALAMTLLLALGLFHYLKASY